MNKHNTLNDRVVRCFECENPADHEHHVVPKSKGGKRTIPLCDWCHAKVHSRHLLSTSRLTRDALREKRNKNQRIGQVPYGYSLGSDGVQLIVIEKQQAVIRWMVSERKKGATLRAICNELKSSNEQTATSKNEWQPNTVRKIIEKRVAKIQKKPIQKRASSLVVFLAEAGFRG